MQRELLQENPATKIRLLGVNDAALADGNPAMTEGRTLPWLQDTNPPDAWNLWDVRFRDVVILDTNNVELARFNLTVNSLSDPANYAQLKSLLRRVAGE